MMKTASYNNFVRWAAGHPRILKLCLKFKIIPRYWPQGFHDEANEKILAWAEVAGPMEICTFNGRPMRMDEPFITWNRASSEGWEKRVHFKSLFETRLMSTKNKLVKELFNDKKKRVNKSKNKPVLKKKGAVSPVRPARKSRGKVGTGTRNSSGDGGS